MSLPATKFHPKRNVRRGRARATGAASTGKELGRNKAVTWFSRHDQREERAQVVTRCAIRLAAGSHDGTIGDGTLEVLRVADHDSTTLQHATALCRSLLRDDPTNATLIAAIGLLERATTFLGIRPQGFDATDPRRLSTRRLPEASTGPDDAT